VTTRARRWLWASGAPARFVALIPVRLYRVSVGHAVGGRCRFYPSCSEYAERAIREVGAVRGSALAAWRVLRCSPLSRGGVDHPPTGSRAVYEGVIPRGDAA
jgi:putative membrane protein insertion efficiency factor